jgi:hypothetical protein
VSDACGKTLKKASGPARRISEKLFKVRQTSD